MGDSTLKKSFVTLFLCSLFLSLTVAFFSPFEVVLMNASEFRFSVNMIWSFQLIAVVAGATVISLLLFLLPARVGRIVSACIVGFGCAFWTQMLFLNGRMVSLTGQEMIVSRLWQLLDIFAWTALIVGFLVLGIVLVRKNQKTLDLILRGVSAALIVMQSVAFVTLFLIANTGNKGFDRYLTTEKEFEFSSGTNVVEFILDTADGRRLQQMLENYPELNESLSGWTVYPNVTSTYSRTYPSLTYMLTGEKCYFDQGVRDYIDEAFEKSDFLKRLNDASTDIRVLTMDPALIGNNVDDYIANSFKYKYDLFSNLNLAKLEDNLISISLFKGMPYVLKGRFSYEIEDVNYSSYKPLSDSYGSFDHWADPNFYNAFHANPPTVTDDYSKAFRFYHLWGNHPGTFWNENMDPGPTSDYVNALRGSFKMIESFANYFKDLGIFDNTMFIVTSDHGSSGGGEVLEPDLPACPILLVKYPNSDTGKPLEFNMAPVAHEDLFATIEQTFGLTASGIGSGKALDEIPEADARKRYYNYSALYSDEDGEIALIEYEVDGDARDTDNWHKTGNWWDINYSYNTVSAKRYKDAQ